MQVIPRHEVLLFTEVGIPPEVLLFPGMIANPGRTFVNAVCDKRLYFVSCYDVYYYS